MPQLAAIVVLGSLLAFYGNELPDRHGSAFVPIFLLLAWFNPAWRLPLLLAAFYLWSAALLHYHLDHRLLENFDNRLVVVRGLVTDLPEVGNGRIRLYLRPSEIVNYPGRMPRRLRLNWYQDEVVPRPGESWQFHAKLRQPRGLANPAGFDFAAWQFTRGIDAGGYIRHSPLNLRLERGHAGRIDYWRMRLADAIEISCAGCAQRGLIKALALGYRGDITDRERNLLRDSGAAHLLAISGMHIGLVSMLAFACGRLCWRCGGLSQRLNRMQVAALFAMLAALVYAALAGFSLPTVRALVMLAVLLAALQLRQRVNLLQSLSLALVAILLADPRSVGSSSFWLSAGALLVIAFAQFRLPSTLRWWQQLLLLQIFFSLLFAPVGALVFNQFNPASLPANLVAIPLISFIVLPSVLLACLLSGMVPVISGALFRLADRVLQLLLDYLEWLLSAGLEPVVSAYPFALLLLALVLIGLLMLPCGPGLRMAALTGLCLLPLWQPQRPAPGEFELFVLDVGMGTSILVQTRHHSLVYDFGPGRAGVYSAAEWALVPLVRARGIKQPDLVIVSHADQDHSGGLHALVEKYSRLPMLTGTVDEVRGRFDLARPPLPCHEYPPWRWDGIAFSFLPTAEGWNDTNNRSCVLLIEGRHRVLLPGDIELARERELVKNHAALLKADVLLVPHHGSATSSSREFIEQVAPRYAIFTLSRGNRWGFPAATVQARYAAAGAVSYRSDRDGAISISSGPRGLSLRAERRPSRRIWRRW